VLGLKDILVYTNNISVLYVEDNKDVREKTKELLKIYFNDIDIAVDGVDGLNRYMIHKDKSGSYYDLVITDLEMPNMCGLDMCENILKENEIQSIIVITAHYELELLDKSIKLGISGYVNKPIDHEQLQMALYKVSRSISDHKFVESHIKLMEDMNLKLEAQNQELVEKNLKLEKSLRLLDTITHKNILLHPETSNFSSQNNSQIIKQYAQLIQDDIFELKDILNHIDNIIIVNLKNTTSIKKEEIENISALLKRYVSLIETYDTLDDLRNAINDFAKSLDIYHVTDEKLRNTFSLLETSLYYLNIWHLELEEKDVKDVKLFDKTIINGLKDISEYLSIK